MVLNVTITTDCPDTPNTAHDTKVSKYVVKEVEDFVQNITGNRPNLFTACAINYKGAFAPSQHLTLSNWDLARNAYRVERGSQKNSSPCDQLNLSKDDCL